MTDPRLPPCGDLVRAGDPARFRAALFAPPGAREHLFALYAFNLELARIAPMVSEPMLGEIRLQWWREVVGTAFAGGTPRAHEVAAPLTGTIRERHLSRAPLDTLIDARAADLDPAFPDGEAALHRYIEDTAGGLTLLCALALSPGLPDAAQRAARDAGFAIGAARYLLAVPGLTAQGRRPLPMPLVDALAQEGRVRLARARAARVAVPKAAAPALLETAAAGHALTAQRLRSPFRERVSLLWRGASGRW